MRHVIISAVALAASSAPAGVVAQGGDSGQRDDWFTIYSTLSMTDNSTYDAANGDAWSGTGVFGALYDLQVADDFQMANAPFADWFVADYLTFFGGTPADGMQIDVWSWTDHGPGELVSSVTAPIAWGEDFVDPVFGLAGRRLVAHTPIPLAPNTPYYLTLQAIDTSPTGDWYFILRDLDSSIGGDAYGREGDRGNGEQTDWRSMEGSGSGRGDVAMLVGISIPAPGTGMVIGWAALLAGRGRRR